MVAFKYRRLIEIFERVQQCSSTYPKNVRLLQNIYNESPLEEFLKEFMKYMKVALVENENENPFANRLLNFCVLFCTTVQKDYNNDEDTCPFIQGLFKYILKLHDCAKYQIRICKFINLLFSKLGEQDSYLDAEICEKIQDIMMDRLEDAKASTRVQAIVILQRLQNPTDPEDAIVKTFIDFLLDNSAQVRRAIVEGIGLNIQTIQKIVGRCLDIDDSVRLAAFEKFSKFHIRSLTVEQRQFVLRVGFKDNNDNIRIYLENALLPYWFSCCNENYFQFIAALKLDADEGDFKQSIFIAERALKLLFKKRNLPEVLEALPLGPEKLLSSDVINWEEVIYWKCVVQFIKDDLKNMDVLDDILPDLIKFCPFIEKVYKKRSVLKNDWDLVQHDFIMFELLKFCEYFDLGDETGRKELSNLITNLLTNARLMRDNIEMLVKLFAKTETDINIRINKLCEIVSEIHEPLQVQPPNERQRLDHDMKLAELRVKLNIAINNKDEAVENQDFTKAQELKSAIEEIHTQMQRIEDVFVGTTSRRVARDDPDTLCKCLDILNATVLTSDIKKMLPELLIARDQFVKPLLETNNDPEVFHRGLLFLGACSVMDETFARKTIQILCTPFLAYKYMRNCDEQTTLTAIQCVNDIVLQYGSSLFDSDVDQTLNTTKKRGNTKQLFSDTQLEETASSISILPSVATYENIIEILSDMMDDVNQEIRELATLSILKLMCSGHVHSAPLLSRLILKWFNPATAKDGNKIRQLIGQIFTEYMVVVSDSLEILEQVFLPTIKAIMDAPKNSPVADIDLDPVLRFLVEISRPGRHRYNMSLDTHKHIALLLCKEICDRPNNKYTMTYLKALTYLEPPRDDTVALRDLQKQVDVMLELIKDKHVLKHVLKYRFILNVDDSNVANASVRTAETQNTNVDNSSKSGTTTSDETSLPILNTSTNLTNRDTTVSTSMSETEKSTINDKQERYTSLSVKRKKKRGGPSLTENKETNDFQKENMRNLRNGRQQTVVSETDSDVSPRKAKQPIRRSNRKRK